MSIKVYQEISRKFSLYNRNLDHYNKILKPIEYYVKKYLPSGMGMGVGVDNGSDFDFDYEKSKENKLIFNSSFHPMNDGGYYISWIPFKIVVVPCLSFGYDIKIIGKFKNPYDKDYLLVSFCSALDTNIED